MGFLADRRKRKEAEAAAKAAALRLADARADRADWVEQVAELEQRLEMLDTWWGSDVEGWHGFIEKKGETAFLMIEGVALIEPRRTPGHWQGSNQGASFRVAKGVSYRVGGTRGTYVPGPDVPTPIDVGDALISNQRVVFIGQKATREWAYAKLVGVMHDDTDPWTALQVTNRQKVSGILYGWEAAEDVRWRLTLALASFLDERDKLRAQVSSELADLRTSEPADPDAAAPRPAG